jgi:hypothetical protein
MLYATVTMPDGSPAVVHSETIGWAEPVISADKRAELIDTVRSNFAFVAAEPHTHCPTIRTASPELVTTSEAGRYLWFDANVLCTQARCRAEAEQYEAEVEHPDAYRLRAWGQSAGLARAAQR